MLTRLQLLHYRNHQSAGYSFDNQTVLINGPNGSGKTNLLDAIYFCCMCRSYFLRQDQLLVQHGHDFFRLDASFDNQGQTDEVSVKVVSGRKKEVLLNGVAYEKLADHIGQFPVIMITPDDTRLIQQYADERRRFLDLTISQVDREYLFDLQQYQKVLAQRNALLKQAWQRGLTRKCWIHWINNCGRQPAGSGRPGGISQNASFRVFRLSMPVCQETVKYLASIIRAT